MLQKLPVNGFKWDEEIPQFNKDFTENYKKIVMEDIFLELMLNILKNHMIFTLIYIFI